MDEIRSQAWVARFESAFMELDPKRLIERIGKAEAAIDARLFDLRHDSDHHKERELIMDAQRTLRYLRHPKKSDKAMSTLAAAKKKLDFEPRTLRSIVNGGRKILYFRNNQTIFAQGDPSDAVFHIQKGKVKLTVVAKSGKEATVGVLDEGDFFGERCLAGLTLRLNSATALTDCTVLRIDKKAMMDALHRERAFCDRFIAQLLARNIRFEENLVDQLFNSAEKRLARILLLLSRFDKKEKLATIVPKLSQEMLAEMVGTTRSRVSFFMNRFRKLGFIDYNSGGLQVHNSLLNFAHYD